MHMIVHAVSAYKTSEEQAKSIILSVGLKL